MDSAELPSPIMYDGAPSPIFDAPEFPSLRRVKPLPKRRRTSAASDAIPQDVDGMLPPMLPPMPGPDATAEELLAHAEELSAQMALQSYYMPIIGGMQDFIKNEAGYAEHSGTPPIDFGAGFGGGNDEDEHGDGDYIDHLQQPGNTKKRKVPANQSASQHGPDSADGHSGGEDEQADRAVPGGMRQDADAQDAAPLPPPPEKQRRGKMLPATLVGLQHKEILKNRKRQLAAVLANYPLLNTAFGGSLKASGIKPSVRRRASRLARRYAKAIHPTLPDGTQRYPFPTSEFTFVCHSSTSDRLIATREEVAVLHARFEAELARQAAKAAEAAKLAAEAARAASKATERAQRKARTGAPASQPVEPVMNGQAPGVKLRGKKKKRSALANASNPHHLRNYVPSRLPNQGPANSAPENFLSPFPLQFLSAQIPPRRRKNNAPVPAIPQLVNPADEWICPFCEYELFYGDEQAYRRGVRNRKKILKRRRRARERAAAAASGANAAAAPTNVAEDEVEEGYDVMEQKAASKAGQPKTGREKEGDGGGPVEQAGR